MTIRCRHCGLVDVTDPEIVQAYTVLLADIRAGHPVLPGLTCPLCNDEVRSADVSLDRVCPRCDAVAALSDARERGVTFHQPVCARCRTALMDELSVAR